MSTEERRPTHYNLDGKTPVPCENFYEWGCRFGSYQWRVALDERDNIQVSTVFLGLDHQWGDGPPLLFETMIFGLGDDEEQEQMWRYATWEEAEAGHKRACRLAFGEGSDIVSTEAKKRDIVTEARNRAAIIRVASGGHNDDARLFEALADRVERAEQERDKANHRMNSWGFLDY